MKEELKKDNQKIEKDKYVGVFQKSKNFGFVVRGFFFKLSINVIH